MKKFFSLMLLCSVAIISGNELEVTTQETNLEVITEVTKVAESTESETNQVRLSSTLEDLILEVQEELQFSEEYKDLLRSVISELTQEEQDQLTYEAVKDIVLRSKAILEETVEKIVELFEKETSSVEATETN